MFEFNGRKQGKWRITLSAGAVETNAVAEALATVAAMAVSTRREDTLDIKLLVLCERLDLESKPLRGFSI
jgi:hypothetical protein